MGEGSEDGQRSASSSNEAREAMDSKSPPRVAINTESSDYGGEPGSNHGRTSPRHQSIPETILEDAEMPSIRDLHLGLRDIGDRQTHSRSTSASPDPSNSLKPAAHQPHRSPNIPENVYGRGTSAELEKENQLPRTQHWDKLRIVTANPSERLARNTSRTPELEERGQPEYSAPRVEPLRSGMRGGMMRTDAQESETPRIAPQQHAHVSQPGLQSSRSGDHYGGQYAPYPTAPGYHTPGQAPLMRHDDGLDGGGGGLQQARTAPAIPPQSYYTEMAAATPAPALPPGRKGLIVSAFGIGYND